MLEGNNATTSDASGQLFTALAEQLKMPLLQIARLAGTANSLSLPQITVISEHALRLVDAYVQAQTTLQTELKLEPVTTGAVLYEVAATLQSFAEHHQVEIELDSPGRAVPVLANRESLKTMMTLVAASLIETSDNQDEPLKRLVLGTHRSSKGMVVGAFSVSNDLAQRTLRLTRELHKQTNSAAPVFGVTGAAALAIADQLSEQMATPLKSYRHRSLSGVGALLLPSRQLQLLA